MTCLALIVSARISLAAPDPPQADLYVSAADIIFLVYGEQVNSSLPGDLLAINVTVHSEGNGDVGPANATFRFDGNVMGTLPVPGSVVSELATNVSFLWDTSGAVPGVHEIGVAVEAPSDSNKSNNEAFRTFIFLAIPVVTVSIDNSSTEAANNEYGPVNVTFTGHVQLDRPAWQNVSIVLDASGFGTPSVDPAEMFFGPGESEQNFTVNCTVPQRALTNSDTSFVVGAWALVGYNTVQGSASSSVVIEPYYYFWVESTDQLWRLQAGGQTDFCVTISNQGNSVDSYRLDIMNKNELEKKGFSLKLEQAVIDDVAPRAGRTVMVHVQAPQDWPPHDTIWRKHEYTGILLNVSSVHTKGGHNVTMVAELDVEMSGFYAPAQMAFTAAVAGVTMVFILLPVKWPRKWKMRRKKVELTIFTAGIFVLAIGIMMVTVTQAVDVPYGTDRTGGPVPWTGGGIEVLPICLPFILTGTAITCYYTANEGSRRKWHAYLVIMMVETVLVAGFVAYPQNVDSTSEYGNGRGHVTVSPIFDRMPFSFLLLFSLLLILGLCLWYLFRPDTWPLKAVFAGPPKQEPASVGPKEAARD